MSEPKTTATSVEEVVPGVFHWRVQDERIDFVSAAHAIRANGGAVLIDPLPLVPDAFAGLGTVEAVCLTCGSHQRSAWRIRRELGVPVYAPALVRDVEEEPDVRYSEGESLPGGLLAVFTPGAGTTQHTLLLEGEPGVAFVPDLLLLTPGGNLQLTDETYIDDPGEMRRSVERLLDLPFDVCCLGHGPPLVDDPKREIRRALLAD